jgi:hypothetical protein
LSEITDHQIGTILWVPPGTIEAVVSLDSAHVHTREIRKRKQRSCRDNEPPINGAGVRVWLQRFRRIESQGIAAIGGGDHLDAVIFSARCANLPVIFRNNVVRSDRRKIKVHYRSDVVDTFLDRLGDKQVREIFNNIWNTRKTDGDCFMNLVIRQRPIVGRAR